MFKTSIEYGHKEAKNLKALLILMLLNALALIYFHDQLFNINFTFYLNSTKQVARSRTLRCVYMYNKKVSEVSMPLAI